MYDPEGFGEIGWDFENTECYVYDTEQEGTVPLYRYFHQNTADHFYTIDFNTLGFGGNGWYFEGIACYVSP